MRAKDIKPGVVYGYRDHFHGIRPIVFLAPIDRGHLYIKSRTSGPAFQRAPDSVAGPRPGSVYNSGTVGYPAALGKPGYDVDDLREVTLARFEQVTSTLGRRCEYGLVVRLARVIGPWETASPDSSEED